MTNEWEIQKKRGEKATHWDVTFNENREKIIIKIENNGNKISMKSNFQSMDKTNHSPNKVTEINN